MQTNTNSNVNVSIHRGIEKEFAPRTPWEDIVQTGAFQVLIQKKKSFIVPATIFFMLFYFTLPVLTAYTTVLNKRAVGAINWAYMYAFAQFAMTWALCHLYMKKAKQFDQLVDKVKEDAEQKGVKIG